MTFTTVDFINVIGNQTIFSPKDMMIKNEKVIIRKLGNALYLVPFNNPWKYLMDSLDFFTIDFMEDRNQPEWNQKSPQGLKLD
jgi:antitoxin VapB